MYRTILTLLAGATVIALCPVGCRETRLGARGTGDVSNPPAEREAYDARVKAACGSGSVAAAGAALRRRPYLQQVTSRSAKVLWTEAGEGEAKVRVKKPSGELVAEVVAQPEATVYLEGARQMVASLEGLEPSTLYCYEVERAGATMVTWAGFRTSPGPGEPVRFIVWGDSGKGNGYQRSVVEQLGTVPFDFIVHTGDVAYETGTLLQFETNVFGVYGDLFRSFPVFASSGNHDYATDDAGPFREVFSLPENGGPGGVERWYSYDWGDAHMVALDTEQVSEAQAAWLDADLSATRRPWTIVYFHKPPFSSGAHGPDPAAQATLVPVLERHQVPLVLSGHEHDYERFKPRNGVNYVVTGGGGAETTPIKGSPDDAYGEDVLHFVYVTIEGPTLRLHTIDGLGREFDSLIIQR